MKVIISFSWLWILVAAGLSEASSWQWVGPVGGGIEQIVADPYDPDVWFVINNNRLYRTTNAGKSWKPLAKPRHVFALYFRPVDKAIVLRGSLPYGIWISYNQGTSFALQAILPTYPGPVWIREHPFDPNVYFSGSCGLQLGLSTDGGRSWQEPPQSWQYGFRDVVVSPFDHNVLYVSACHNSDDWCTGSVILKTDLKFSKWSVIEAGRSGGYLSFHQDPRFGDRIFFSAPGKAGYLSKSGWKILSKIENLIEIHSVPGNPSRLLAIQRNCCSDTSTARIVQSDDFGKNWTKLPNPLENTLWTLSPIGHGSGFFAGTFGSGLYRVQGQNKESRNEGLRESPPIVSIVSSGSSGYLALAGGHDSWFSMGRFLYRSDNSGSSWKNLTYTFAASGEDDYKCCITSMAVDPADVNRILLAGYKNLLRSTDGGLSWIRQNHVFDSLEWDPVDRDVLYATQGERAESPGVFKSTDGGASFQQLPIEFDEEAYLWRLAIDSRNNQILFVMTIKGLYRSADGGKTINRIRTAEDYDDRPKDLVPAGPPGSYLLIDARSRLFKTTDNGVNWEQISEIIDDSFLEGSLYPADGQGIHYYAIVGHGLSGRLYESKDGAQHWTEISSSLGIDFQGTWPDCSVTGLSDPRRGPLLVATCQGIYRGSGE